MSSISPAPRADEPPVLGQALNRPNEPDQPPARRRAHVEQTQPGPAIPPPPLQRDVDEVMRIAMGSEMRLRRPEVAELEAQVR